jgi:hypothetical protein
MKIVYQFLRIFFVVYLGKTLLRWFHKGPEINQRNGGTKAEGQPRYSKNSKRLWEDNPRCKGGMRGNEFEYRGEFKNIKGEPVFYAGGNRLTRVLPTFKNRGGVVKPKINGFFNAHPGGLDLDQYTGEINIKESDTGIRYAVEYTPCGKNCVTSTNVVISGIGYEGRVVSLTKSGPDGPDGFILRPHYFGSRVEQFREVPSDRVPPGNFKLPDQKPNPNLPDLEIDPRTGAVDLRATVQKGALGFSRNGDFPENGTCKKFKIHYKLDTGPGQGIENRTNLQIHFYNELTDVPEELLVRIRQQNNTIYRNSLSLPLLLGIVMTSITSLQDLPWEGAAALLAALTSFLILSAGSDNPCRPPEVVIIR